MACFSPAALLCFLLLVASLVVGAQPETSGQPLDKLERATWSLLDALLPRYPAISPSEADRTAAKGLLKSLAHFYPSSDLGKLVKADGLAEETASRAALSRYVCELKKLLLSTEGASAGGDCESYFLPLPAAAQRQRGLQQGTCELGDAEVNEWLQGHTTLRSGAMTLLLFISQSCDVCHEVLPKIDRLYRLYRHNGLNVIAIHSAVKGHRSSAAERRGIVDFFSAEQLSFPLVDMTFKAGAQPYDEFGLPDWRAAAKAPVKKGSLYHRLFDDMEFVTPLAFIVKNCQALMEHALDSYSILALDVSIARAAETMLWPDDAAQPYSDSFQMPPEEQGGSWLAGDGSGDGEGEGEGDSEGEEDEDEDEESSRRRRRRRSEL